MCHTKCLVKFILFPKLQICVASAPLGTSTLGWSAKVWNCYEIAPAKLRTKKYKKSVARDQTRKFQFSRFLRRRFCAFSSSWSVVWTLKKVLRAAAPPSRSEFFVCLSRTLLYRSSAKELNFRFWSKKSFFFKKRKTIQNGIIIITNGKRNIIFYIYYYQKKSFRREFVTENIRNGEYPEPYFKGKIFPIKKWCLFFNTYFSLKFFVR